MTSSVPLYLKSGWPGSWCGAAGAGTLAPPAQGRSDQGWGTRTMAWDNATTITTVPTWRLEG